MNDLAYNLDDFTWQVSNDRYHIGDVNTESGELKRAIILSLEGEGLPFNDYVPQKNPAMFFDFANTDPTEARVLAFANQYGSLKPKYFNLAKIDADNEPKYYEEISEWFNEMREMAKVLDFWDSINKKDNEKLSQQIHLESNGYCYTDGFFKEQYLVRINKKPKDLTNPALEAVATMIDAAFVRHPIKRSLGHNYVEKCLYRSPMIKDLISLLWFQVEEMVVQNRAFRTCAVCKKYFEIKPPVTRKTKIYCSGACNAAAYRKRKAK